MRAGTGNVPLRLWLSWMESWAMLLNAGLPTLESLAFGLEHIEDSRAGRRLGAQLQAVYAALQQGLPLAEAFSKHAPGAPPALRLALVCGQASGDLGAALVEQLEHCKHTQAQQSALLKSLVYPCFVLLMALGAWTMLAWFAPPAALQGHAAPALAGVYAATGLDYWLHGPNLLLSLGGLGLLLAAGLAWAKRRQRRVLAFPRHLGWLGPQGPAAVAEVFFVWSTQLAAGLDWMQCLAQTQAQPWSRGSKRLHNEVLLFCMQLQRGVARGLTVAQAMAAAQAPKFMVQQAELAEQTGRLDRCFLLLYHFYDTQAKQRLQRLNALLGPATLLLAALVLGLAFSTTLAPLYGGGAALAGGW